MINNLALDIIKRFGITDVVETGVHEGCTLSLILDWNAVELNAPVIYHGVDIVPSLVQAAISTYGPLDVRCQDSREFLKAIIPILDTVHTLFYLDAHWFEDWPLLGELKILSVHKTIIIIDNCKVPGCNYRYDTYHGQELCADFIKQGLVDASRTPFYYMADANQDGVGQCILFPGFSEAELTILWREPFNIDKVPVTGPLKLIKDA